MDPSLLNYLQQVQNEADQFTPNQHFQEDTPQYNTQEYNPANDDGAPFRVGIEAARAAAKQSLGMNEEEKKRAQGLAIMSFFNNLSKGGFGPGFQGALGGISQSLHPAMQAYLEEQARVAALNNQLDNQYQEAQAQQAALQQKAIEKQEMMQHRQAQLAETRRAHEAMERLKQAQLGETHGYHQASLALKQAEKDLRSGAEQQEKRFKAPPQLLSKIAKDLEKLQGAEQELEAYDTAEHLLENEDPLYNPVAQGAFNIIGGRPGAFKSPAQAQFESLEGDIRRKKFKGAGLRSQLEYQDIKTIDPTLSKEANLAIIRREKAALQPIMDKKAKLEDLYGKLASGEDVNLHEYANYIENPTSQAALQQELITVMDPDTGERKRIKANDVDYAVSRGWKVAQ